MIKIFNEPLVKDWPILLERPAIDARELYAKVQPILDAVKSKGDEALKAYTSTLDKVVLKKIKLETPEWKQLPPEELRTKFQAYLLS